MEKVKVTFENEDGSKKAIVSFDLNEKDTMTINCVFEPDISPNDNALYAHLAIDFLQMIKDGK